MKFATKPYSITHLNLGMLLHYLEKLQIHIICILCITRSTLVLSETQVA